MNPLTIPCFVITDGEGVPLRRQRRGVEELAGTVSDEPEVYSGRAWAEREARRLGEGCRVVECVATVEALDAPCVVEAPR